MAILEFLLLPGRIIGAGGLLCIAAGGLWILYLLPPDDPGAFDDPIIRDQWRAGG